MGFYPDIIGGPRSGTREWDDHILRQPEPHKLEAPYSCSCAQCNEWRRVQVQPGCLVIGRVLDPRRGSGGLAWTWAPGEEPNWGSPLQKPSIILGTANGKASREDLDCVVLLTPDMGLRCSAAEWLVVLAGGRVPAPLKSGSA